MTDVTPIQCDDCGRLVSRRTRGVCSTCYMRHWKAGTHTQLARRELPPAATVEKSCAICRVVKPLDEFGRNKARRDGHGAYCLPCQREKYLLPAMRRKRLVPQHFDGTQTCRVCEANKPVADFYWSGDKGRYEFDCKECRSKRERAKNATPEARQKLRAYNIGRKYGMTVADFDLMLAAQGGGCAICGVAENPDALSLAIDHCHDTGRIRGILCGPCNKAIGLLRDDPRLLRKAVTYLGR